MYYPVRRRIFFGFCLDNISPLSHDIAALDVFAARFLALPQQTTSRRRKGGGVLDITGAVAKAITYLLISFAEGVK